MSLDENSKSSEICRSKGVFLDVSAISVKELQDLANLSDQSERTEKIFEKCLKVEGNIDKISKDILSVVPMTWSEELSACFCFALGVPGSVITIPALLCIIGFFIGSYLRAFLGGLLLLLPLMFNHVPFIEQSLTSWLAIQILKYFSFK